MNQLSIPFSFAAQDYFTAAELAQIAKVRGIKGFPSSERGVQLLAEREGWNDLPSSQSRQRPAQKAGGRPAMEYRISILPEILQRVIAGMSMRAKLIQRVAEEGDADRRKLAALKSQMLPEHPRAVMTARAEILRSIEGYAVSHGRPRSWGIAQFLTAQKDWRDRQEIERKRDGGEILTDRQAASLTKPLLLTGTGGFDLKPELLGKANDRRGNPVISERTLWRWFKTRDERDVVALAPIPPKKEQEIPAAFHEFLKFWAVPSKPSVPKAHRAYVQATEEGNGAQPMTLDQIQHIMRKKMRGLDKYVGREGLLTLRSRMAYITRTTDEMWPTTIYTADGKTFDAEIADPVSNRPMRPEITSVLDVATRKCVGYAISRKENVIAVTEALRRSCSAHGICAIFYTDRGAGYKNKTFDADVGGLMGRLGITKMHALPYNSQAKGIIERFNHVWNDLARSLPTYIGRDMDKEAKHTAHKETRREIREFGRSRRLPSWEDFTASVEATIAEYNERPHTGLPKFEDPETGRRRHMSPNEAWEAHAAAGFEPIRIDPEEEDDLFRPYVKVTTRRSLVRWNTNDYFHTALEGYYGETVMVGYDLNQADKVWVREFDPESGNPGKLICIAVFAGNAERYIPLTAEQKAVEARNKAALKRLDDKKRAKEAELDAPYLIDSAPVEPANFIDITPVEADLVSVEPDNVTQIPTAAPAKPKRLTFASDEDLATWALQNPTKLNPNQIAVLRRCMKDSTARKLFELSGIDLEALRNLLRAAA